METFISFIKSGNKMLGYKITYIHKLIINLLIN